MELTYDQLMSACVLFEDECAAKLAISTPFGPHHLDVSSKGAYPFVYLFLSFINDELRAAEAGQRGGR